MWSSANGSGMRSHAMPASTVVAMPGGGGAWNG